MELVARGSLSSTKAAVVDFGHQASPEEKFTARVLGVPRGGLFLRTPALLLSSSGP